MNNRARATIGIALAAAAAFAVLYYPVAVWLIDDWDSTGNYSHGYLVVPISLYFAWQRREVLRATPLRPSLWGLAALVASMALLLAGTVAAETFLTRISLVCSVVSVIWFVAGAQHVRLLKFPLAFLLLMIPIPDIIFNRVAFPLQLIASSLGEAMLHAASVPVLRDGNLIVLPRMTLEVAEACSGIRSLVTLFTLAVLYSHTSRCTSLMYLALLAATVPIAIGVNGVRVALTGLLAYRYGIEAAEGLLHTMSGWMMFVLAGLALVGVHQLLVLASRLRPMSWTTRAESEAV